MKNPPDKGIRRIVFVLLADLLIFNTRHINQFVVTLVCYGVCLLSALNGHLYS